VLLIHGAEDSFVPIAEIEAVKARLPNASLLAIPQTGHIPQLGPQSDPISENVQGFLARIRGVPGNP
jgi:pimeloyl-ACP methyl ester carboxylesterase